MMVKVTEREHSLSILQTMSVHYKCRTKGCYVKQVHLCIRKWKHPVHPQNLSPINTVLSGTRPD